MEMKSLQRLKADKIIKECQQRAFHRIVRHIPKAGMATMLINEPQEPPIQIAAGARADDWVREEWAGLTNSPKLTGIRTAHSQ
jgi:hypothetical protein